MTLNKNHAQKHDSAFLLKNNIAKYDLQELNITNTEESWKFFYCRNN